MRYLGTDKEWDRSAELDVKTKHGMQMEENKSISWWLGTALRSLER